MSWCVLGRSWMYEKKDIVGKGRFGFLYMAKVCNDENSTASLVVKEIHLPDSWHPPNDTLKWQNLLDLAHPNIVRYHKVTCYENPSKIGILELLMDYIPDGDLSNFVSTTIKTTNRLPLVKLVEFGNQIACGLLFLHDRNIVHSDLKPAHILLRRQLPPWGYQLYISGLELGILMQQDVTNIPVGHLRGSPRFMSPETVQACVHGKNSKDTPGKESDIWSLGCIMLTLFDCHTGKTENLFYHESTNEFLVLKENNDPAVLWHAAQGFLPAVRDVPYDLAEIIKGCLIVDRQLRFTAVHCVNALTQYREKKQTILPKEFIPLSSSEHEKLISCEDVRGSTDTTVAVAEPNKNTHEGAFATWRRVINENVYCVKATVIAIAATGFVMILLVVWLHSTTYYHFTSILPSTLVGFLCIAVLLSLAFIVNWNTDSTKSG
ncbi:uncharacterized protein LOC129586045 [Paramacrobiotus metropolitanus]|uniref:uncharacterized protein LOC129586045 n=1 Tax=Paramacrobiotus metropolitanus TaxID=2943436 RepID=UPI002446452E|nr:uncharacterized protein LOC129586045 [Paramacrobiotus metropolitanus]